MAANRKLIELKGTRGMNATEIDVSKRKSTVAIMRPFGEGVAEPFEAFHADAKLRKLAYLL